MTGSIKQSKPYIIGISGGSGSGKTFFAKALVDKLGHKTCEIVYQDNFYFDQSEKFDFDGGSVNFDHPKSIDFDCLARCLTELKNGGSTDIPTYDFAKHKRKPELIKVSPKPIILVDGILIFHAKNVRRLFDDLVFFDAPEKLRYERRLERDVNERGRTKEGVKAQFENQVKPMHDKYVEPSKVHSRLIVSDDGFDAAVAEFTHRLLRLRL